MRGIQGALIPSVPTNVRCSRRFFDDLCELSGSAFVVLGGPVHLMVGIDPVGLWRCRNTMA